MKKQQGFLVMVVAVLLVIVAALGSVFVFMQVSASNTTTSAISKNTAHGLAKTGIELGNYQLKGGDCIEAWSASVAVSGQGEYQYNCKKYTASTTSTSALTVTSIELPVSNKDSLADFGSVIIDAETIYYDGISGLILKNLRRGMMGTVPASHNSGAVVAQDQYVVGGKGGAPALSSPTGVVNLYQAGLRAGATAYYAVGENIILSFIGTTWAISVQDSFTYFKGIHMSSTYGIVVGSRAQSGFGLMYEYTFSSAGIWSQVALQAKRNLQAVSCDLPNNPNKCSIVGQLTAPDLNPYAFYTSTMQPYNLASSKFMMNTVSCYNGICMAAGQNDVYRFPVTNNPFNPINSTNAGGSSIINHVHCPMADNCVIVRSTGDIIRIGLKTASFIPAQPVSLNGVYCPTTGNCIVVGNQGVIYNCAIPSDLSTISCTKQSSPGTMDLGAVFCSSAYNCLAIASNSSSVAYYLNNGIWTSKSLPGTYTLNDISGIQGVGAGVGFVLSPTVYRNQN